MKNFQNIIKNSFKSDNQNELSLANKTLKDKIKELIKKNDEAIKKFEKLKEQSKNSQKKMEYLKMISKFRTRQISLHNKLHSLELLINTYTNNYRNNIINKKAKSDSINIIKNAYNKKFNSNSYDYISLYINNNDLFKNKIKKKNSKVNSTNNLNNFIQKPSNKNPNIQNKKIEIKKPNNNYKNVQSFANVPNNLRINTNINNFNNSTMILNSHKQNNYNYYAKTNNKNDNSNSKSIIIINNINNYYGKIENTTNNNVKMTEHIINDNLRKKIKDKILKYNLINEDEVEEEEDESEYLDSEIKNEEQKIIEEKEFKSNPNLVFRTNILKIKKNVVIEIFNSFNNKNKIYAAISEKNILGYNIKIFKFKNRKFVTRLRRHKHRIIEIKHFFNKNKMHDFIISGDTGLFINIWDISYKYLNNQFLFSIKYQGEKIYKSLPVSIQQKENNLNNYLLIYDKSITIYDLKNGNYIKNINHSRLLNEKIINIIMWKNKNNNFDYIIKCSENKITIFNFIDSEIFFTLSDYSNNEDKIKYITEGCITSGNENELLCIFSYSTYLLNIHLEIWDLYELNLKKKIMPNRNLINDVYLLNLLTWNYKYILFSDGNKNNIYVIDLESNKIISKFYPKYKNDVNHIYFKKIYSKEFGESLVTWKHKNCISLFSNKGVS